MISFLFLIKPSVTRVRVQRLLGSRFMHWRRCLSRPSTWRDRRELACPIRCRWTRARWRCGFRIVEQSGVRSRAVARRERTAIFRCKAEENERIKGKSLKNILSIHWLNKLWKTYIVVNKCDYLYIFVCSY